MRWTPGGRSKNLEDLRGQTGGGRMIRRPRDGDRRRDHRAHPQPRVRREHLRRWRECGPVPQQSVPGDVDQPVSSTPEEEKRMQFVSFVLDDVQQTWAQLLPKVGDQYRDAKLAVFRDGVQTGCGDAPSCGRSLLLSRRSRRCIST